MPQENPNSRGIQSIEVGFEVIAAILETPTSKSLSQIAERIKMTPSRAHSYLTSFKRVGLIAQDEDTGRYMLGSLALDLGLAALSTRDGLSHSRSLVRRMQDSDLFDGQFFISIWSEAGPVIVSRSEGFLDTPFEIRIGHHPSTLQTATGRVFTAYLPRNRTEGIVRRELRETDDGVDEETISRVYESCEATRHRGYETVNSVTIPGLIGIAVPVFDYDESLTSVITMVESAASISMHEARQTAKQMLAMISGDTIAESC